MLPASLPPPPPPQAERSRESINAAGAVAAQFLGVMKYGQMDVHYFSRAAVMRLQRGSLSDFSL
jgi:hypothetical protein